MLPAQIPAAAPEVVALGSAIADVIASAKGGGSALADAEAALPDLMAAIGGAASFGVDLKKPENQAYLGWAVAQALEPKV